VPHTYATLDEANDYLISGGSTKFTTEPATTKALKLSILEEVSRRIDFVCHRSAFGSGFGPRVGTNKYDGDGSTILTLKDDLLSLTTLGIATITGGAPVTAAVDTDYFLANADGYTGPPWRRIVLHGNGLVAYGTGYRTTEILGTWGHSNVTIPTSSTVASGLSVGTTATTFATSASPDLSPGMTLLIGSEQLYLYELAATTATVVRGANGTTAATHADASVITRYVYDSRARGVGLRLFQRRWKARDAGADGTSGGMGIPTQTTNEGEDTIIRRALSDLMFIGMV